MRRTLTLVVDIHQPRANWLWRSFAECRYVNGCYVRSVSEGDTLLNETPLMREYVWLDENDPELLRAQDLIREPLIYWPYMETMKKSERWQHRFRNYHTLKCVYIWAEKGWSPPRSRIVRIKSEHEEPY